MVSIRALKSLNGSDGGKTDVTLLPDLGVSHMGVFRCTLNNMCAFLYAHYTSIFKKEIQDSDKEACINARVGKSQI